MTEGCPGQAGIRSLQIIAQGSEAEIQSLSDGLFKFAQHNFHNTVITQVTKESAEKFKEDSLPASNISFHLQSVEANFIFWMGTDPRVSKEVLKCKILPSAVSCFPFSRQKVKHDKARELSYHSPVLPKMEQRVCNSQIDPKTTGETCITSNSKWTEESIQVTCKPPYWVCAKKQSANAQASFS